MAEAVEESGSSPQPEPAPDQEGSSDSEDARDLTEEEVKALSKEEEVPETKAEEANAPTDSASKKKARPPGARSRSDFEFGTVLGEGSYAQVVLGTEIATKKIFAVKILNKKHIVREKKVEYVKTEKLLMDQLNHPNIVKLAFTFQDPQFLYFVMEYCPNGELFDAIKKHGSFNEECTRFYAAEIADALDHMHSKDIIHRDLKPENLLMSKDMHLKMTDFGTATKLEETEEGRSRATTFTGTAEYVSPEVLKNEAATPSSDLWALGCTIYQMVAGVPPFVAINEYHTFQRILACDFSFPEGFPEAARDLITKMLVENPTERLGAKGMDEIREHPFFNGIDWETLAEQTPPELKTGLAPPRPPPDQAAGGEGGFSMWDSEQERERKLEEQKKTPWSKFLFPNEMIVHMGPVSKRRGLSIKKRHLILTDFPRLIYVDPVKLEQKGEIVWSDQLRPERKNNKSFQIHVPNRTYNLEDLTGKAQDWIKAIVKVQERMIGSQ